MSAPLVSIIIPVYNAEKFIHESLASIVSQTYTSLEIIVLNDGSTDSSEAIIKKISDPRIKYVAHSNRGMAATLNAGLKMCAGKYIARQDADDISRPDRIQKQVEFLEENKDVALAGTWAEIIDEHGKSTRKFHRHPPGNDELKFGLLFDNPFVHSSVMFTRAAIDTHGNYNEKLHALVQDFDLWFRISRKYNIANLSEDLQLYRQTSDGISAATQDFSGEVIRQSAEHLKEVLGCDNELAMRISSAYHKGDSETFSEAEFRTTIKKLCDNLKIDNPETRIKLHEHYLGMFRKNNYSRIINDPSTGTIKKFVTKIKRKLLNS
jgi:glycosyltransferase involved in cell wall biosynthesis